MRAEVVAFKSPESNGAVLQQFAEAGGGSVASAADRAGGRSAFTAAARALSRRLVLDIKRPAGVTGAQDVVVTGTAGGAAVRGTRHRGPRRHRATCPAPTTSPCGRPSQRTPPPRTALSALSPMVLIPAIADPRCVGLFFLMVAFMGPVFRSRRKERVSGDRGSTASAAPRPARSATTAAHGHSASSSSSMGDRVMAGRESTTSTMALIDRADLPWRAGEWFVLRIIAVVVGVAGQLSSC